MQSGALRSALRTRGKSGFCSSMQFSAVRCMAGGGGFEPPLTGPEPVVLPLDDPPARPHTNYTTRAPDARRHPAFLYPYNTEQYRDRPPL